MLRRHRTPPEDEQITRSIKAAPSSPAELKPLLDREGPISARLWSPVVEYPTLPSLPAFAKHRWRRQPLIMVLILALVLLGGAGAFVARQQQATSHRQQARATSRFPVGTSQQQSGAQPFSLPEIPAATPLPSAVPTATSLPLPNFALPPFCNIDPSTGPSGAGTPTPTAVAGCVACPYTYDPTTYSISQVQAALQQAAALYQLPSILVEAISWEESGWTFTGGITCNYDAGIMGLKQGYWQWLDQFSDSNCGLTYNTYDPLTLQGNADMGAKLLAFLYCYYGWRAGVGGSVAAPAPKTSDWYYQQAGLAWPDINTLSGAPNPASLCEAPRADQTVHSGFYTSGTFTWEQVYQALPAADPWSCPFSATAGDHTLYELVVTAYWAGTGTVDADGLGNEWYVEDISAHLVALSEDKMP